MRLAIRHQVGNGESQGEKRDPRQAGEVIALSQLTPHVDIAQTPCMLHLRFTPFEWLQK